jgi:glycosyltransferase involved in cell wall biosynthesis
MQGKEIEQKFKQRLAAEFTRHGLQMGNHCRFLPMLSKPAFAGVTSLIDIYLDGIGWSGGNTTMEAIGANRPILTLPGDFMRGRHTSAFLQIMGMNEWIAADKSDYISKAILLGKDPELRRSVSEQVRKRKHLLYRDPEPVRAFESFLAEAVEAFEPKVSTGENALKPTAVSNVEANDDGDPAKTLWQKGVEYQKSKQFNLAAKAFRESLELRNPRYAAADSGPMRTLTQVPDCERGRTELNGLSYPTIEPVADSRPRPFWSVVIPVYNRDLFLLQCLASVLDQWEGDDDMEIIIIDNGSEPALEELAGSIGKGIVKYHYHPETLPLQRNWNSAVNASRGHWIHVLHDDDYVLPGFYAKLKRDLENAPDTIGAAFTAYENIDANDRVIFRNRIHGTQRGIAKDWIETIGVSCPLNPPAVVIRREAYERLGGYSDEILYTTDWEMFLRLVSFYEWWYEPEMLVHYRQHPFNVTAEQNRAGTQGESYWRALEMAEKYLPVTVRDRIIEKSRRHWFKWCLERLRLPMLAGNHEGALHLVYQMVRIDSSPDSLRDLFDWLGSSFAMPLWPAIISVCNQLPESFQVQQFEYPASLFDWLRLDSASKTRLAIAQAMLESQVDAPLIQFEFTPDLNRQAD